MFACCSCSLIGFIMADDAQNSSSAATASAADAVPTPKTPKGVVLGKDGKPYVSPTLPCLPPRWHLCTPSVSLQPLQSTKLQKKILLTTLSCRSCTSFASFTSNTKRIVRGPTATTTATSDPNTTYTALPSSSPTSPPPNCPPDVEALGRSSWTLLHSLSASYPTTPSNTEQTEMTQFMGLFAKMYPCWVCAEDFQEYMRKEEIRVGSRDDFGKWMCGAHNAVNRKLGKKEFDCGKWEERWRTGWGDGSCE